MPIGIFFDTEMENNIDEIKEEVIEIETHLHSNESWFEKAATPNGQIHVADRIGTGSGPFQVDAGNDNWGDWVQVLGSADTPAKPNMLYFDAHRAEFVAAERNESYFVQVAPGDDPDAAVVAELHTEFVLKPASNVLDSGPVDIQTVRLPAGTKAWIRTKCPGQDTATLDFYFGIHEYEE
jgi:hypothetical protein